MTIKMYACIEDKIREGGDSVHVYDRTVCREYDAALFALLGLPVEGQTIQPMKYADRGLPSNISASAYDVFTQSKPDYPTHSWLSFNESRSSILQSECDELHEQVRRLMALMKEDTIGMNPRMVYWFKD